MYLRKTDKRLKNENLKYEIIINTFSKKLYSQKR